MAHLAAPSCPSKSIANSPAPTIPIVLANAEQGAFCEARVDSAVPPASKYACKAGDSRGSTAARDDKPDSTVSMDDHVIV